MIHAPTMNFHTASDGVRLAWRVDDFTDPWKPARTPILLLHPAMGAYRRWYAWIPILAREFPVISLELRGHGASEIPDETKPITVERLCDDVVMMRAGKIVDSGAPAELIARYGRESMEEVFLDVARQRGRETAR